MADKIICRFGKCDMPLGRTDIPFQRTLLLQFVAVHSKYSFNVVGCIYQGDADYLRYHGLQEFDQAMQHLEEIYVVSTITIIFIFLPVSIAEVFLVSNS